MHQTSKIGQILSTAYRLVLEQGSVTCEEVHVALGEFCDLTAREVVEMFDLMKKGFDTIADAACVVHLVEGRYRCVQCGNNSSTPGSVVRTHDHDHPVIVICNNCDSENVKILEGDVIYIDRIIVKK